MPSDREKYVEKIKMLYNELRCCGDDRKRETQILQRIKDVVKFIKEMDKLAHVV